MKSGSVSPNMLIPVEAGHPHDNDKALQSGADINKQLECIEFIKCMYEMDIMDNNDFGKRGCEASRFLSRRYECLLILSEISGS